MNHQLNRLRTELVYIEASIAKVNLDMETRNQEAHPNRKRMNQCDMQRLIHLSEQRCHLLKLIAEETLVRDPCVVR